MTDVLTITGLRGGYGEVEILQGVDMRVGAGALVAIVGPNGAGKTTLLKAVYAIARVTGGTVTFTRDGVDHDITRMPAHKLTRLGLGYVPQLDNVFPNMTIEENLELGATVSPKDFIERRDRNYEIFPLLKDRPRQRAGTLSGGQRQTLALARALMSDPTLLLLDEPSAGLSPQAVEHMFELLDTVGSLGISMLLVEQNARAALARADYAYVLETGANRYEGVGADLLADQRVVDLYLGGGRRTAKPDGTTSQSSQSSTTHPEETP